MTAILLLSLTLAGAVRGVAAASEMSAAAFGIPGVTPQICHTGEAGGSLPGDEPHHDCCDRCVLFAPVTLADAPSVSGPGSVLHYVEHAHAVAWVPTLARLRTPRQSRGPPVA